MNHCGMHIDDGYTVEFTPIRNKQHTDYRSDIGQLAVAG